MSRKHKILLSDPDVGQIHPPVGGAHFTKDGHYYDQAGHYVRSGPDAKPLPEPKVEEPADTQADDSKTAGTGDGEPVDVSKYDFDAYAKGEVKYPWLEIKAAIQAKYGVDAANKEQAVAVILDPPPQE